MFLTYPNQDTSHVFLALWDLDGSQDLKKNRFSGGKKVHFRISDQGESDDADSNEPHFQRPIFLSN